MSVYFAVVLVVALGLVFTYTNGFQDGSSVAASAVASRALSRHQAVFLVALFELLGALLGGSSVASTIAGITSWPQEPSLLPVLASALTAAIAWNFVTKAFGIPSSSTHALVGGVLGAILAASGGWHYVKWGELNHLVNATGICRIVLSLLCSPVVGFLAGYVGLIVSVALLRRATAELNVTLKKMQWFAVPLLAFGHGANDSQKTMGIIMLALASAGYCQPGEMPLWVRGITSVALALGVVSLVPRIIRRVGSIYRLRPLHGLVSEAGSGVIVLIASITGGPLSASQVIASTVIGVGTAERKKGVQWVIAKDMIRAWCLTIPSAGAVAWIVYYLIFDCLGLTVR